MAAINWGYAINKPRVIDIDSNNLRKSDEILREKPGATVLAPRLQPAC